VGRRAAPWPPGPGIKRLRATIDTLGSCEAINDWMDDALAVASTRCNPRLHLAIAKYKLTMDARRGDLN
jgi:hypothetical protein